MDAQSFAQLEPDLFVDLAMVVCSTGVVPQKELHESWQMACRVHTQFPDSIRVADLAAGHGILAWIFVLLARCGETPIFRTAVAVDIKRPKSANILAAAITKRWPDLAGTVHYVEGCIDAVTSEDDSRPLFVAAHACGSLSDRVLLTAIRSQSPVAIMPCCHSLRRQAQTLEALARASGLQSYNVDNVLSSASKAGQPNTIDQIRIDALAALGYEIIESSIQRDITAFNRIIMGRPPLAPRHGVALSRQVPPLVGQIKRLGEIRAYEKIHSLNVSSAADVETLSLRPSREWCRSFDLSFWVEDEEAGSQLAHELNFLAYRILAEDWTVARPEVESKSFSLSVSICDKYTDSRLNRLAFTYRINFGSTMIEITKSDANGLRKRICRALVSPTTTLRKKFEWRGESLDLGSATPV
jgi:Methyltransferase domain